MPMLFSPDRESLGDVKTPDCHRRTAQCASFITQSPNELQNQNCEHKLFRSPLVWEAVSGADGVNDPGPFCLHRSLFAALRSASNIWQSAASRCYLFLLDLPVLTVFERGTLCEVSGEDYMWQIWRGKSREDKQAAKCLGNVWALRQKAISAVDVDMTSEQQ